MAPNKSTKPASQVDVFLSQQVLINALVQKLEFAEEDISRAAREQARLFLEAARYRVQRLRGRLQKEAALRDLTTELGLKMRRTKKNADGERVTEKAISNYIASDVNVIQAQREVDRCNVYEEFSKLLLEAFRHRKDVCKILAEIMQSETNAEVRGARLHQEAKGLHSLRAQVSSRWPGREEGDE